MKSCQTTLEEAPEAHLVPPVIIGIADHKAGKNKEEVHRKVSVIKPLLLSRDTVGLSDMEYDHKQRCHSAQTVQNLISRLGFEINIFVCHRSEGFMQI